MEQKPTLPIARPLNDELLKSVAGGAVPPISRVDYWQDACDRYKCSQCGASGKSVLVHSSSCVIIGFEGGPFDENTQQINHCYSCRFCVAGLNYPKDKNDLYCPYG